MKSDRLKRAARALAWAAVLLPSWLVGCGADAGPPAPAAVPSFETIRQPSAVLLATGGTNGMLEICDCPSAMVGGLARRSGLFASYRAAFGHVFAVDAGNALYFDPPDIRNHYILGGYRLVGYDALVPGGHEWTAGPERLAAARQAPPIVLLSSMAASREQSLDLVDEMVYDLGGGRRLALVSALGPDVLHFLPQEQAEHVTRRDLETLRERIAGLKARGCVVVAIVHGSEEFAEEVAASTAADLLIRGQGTRPADEPKTMAGKPVIQVGGSETVAAIALDLTPAGELTSFAHRLEIVDERWPIDQRLIRLYRRYVSEATRQQEP